MRILTAALTALFLLTTHAHAEPFAEAPMPAPVIFESVLSKLSGDTHADYIPKDSELGQALLRFGVENKGMPAAVAARTMALAVYVSPTMPNAVVVAVIVGGQHGAFGVKHVELSKVYESVGAEFEGVESKNGTGV